MFVIKQSDTYKWPVRFSLPSATKAGQFDTHNVTLEFKRLPQSALAQMTSTDGVTDESLCRQWVVGWEGVYDEEQQPVPFSDSAFGQFLEYPSVASTIVVAYIDSMSGGAKRKN